MNNEVPPLVTVAMPVYNAGKYLRLAVLSIINQTFTNWELLIIDDGSTDTAVQDIADIDDARIRIFRDGLNRGLAARLNEAAGMARGRYLARMDQDDVSYPERFARQLAILQNDAELDLLATRAITIDENDQATGLFPFALSHQEICAKPWRGFYFPHPTWMGKIEWFHKHRYTVPGPFFCEDQELLLRSYRDSRWATLDEILFAYRIRNKVNWQKLAKTRLTVFIVQLRHFAGSGQWHFVLAATAAFVAKLSSDLLKRIGGGNFQPGCGLAEDAIILDWHKTLVAVATAAKVL
ncbi:MAG: glycosyltransferase [Methylococcaceae bacterium]